MTELEVNFGSSPPTRYKTFTVTDAGVAASSKVFVLQSGNAPTGKQADENEMDPIVCNAQPASGSFTLRCKSLDGPVVNKFKFFYGVV